MSEDQHSDSDGSFDFVLLSSISKEKLIFVLGVFIVVVFKKDSV